MIREFNNKKDLKSVLECIKIHGNSEFYFTENNQRIYVNSEKDLKNILSNASFVFCNEEFDEVQGVIAVWKSKGAGVDRNYLKFSCEPERLLGLLRVLLWSFKNELYIKIDKNSYYLELFKEFGFKYSGDRGNQILLKKYKVFAPRRDMFTLNGNGEYKDQPHEFHNRQDTQPYRREH